MMGFFFIIRHGVEKAMKLFIFKANLLFAKIEKWLFNQGSDNVTRG